MVKETVIKKSKKDEKAGHVFFLRQFSTLSYLFAHFLILIQLQTVIFLMLNKLFQSFFLSHK
jgi:hypothetical protein